MLRIPIDSKLNEIEDIPYTISFVIRKRLQVDGLNELPKDKRPPDDIIWNGSTEELDSWIDRVFSRQEDNKATLLISDIEG